MTTSIQFNKTTFSSGYWATATVVNGVVRISSVSTVPAQLLGTVTQPGDKVVLSSALGTSYVTATVDDNSSSILFQSSTNSSVYYVFSNTPLSAGQIMLYTANGLGDYHVPCYLTGTLILTARGQVPVEALVAGDLVVTVSGAQRPIRWIGHKRIDCRTSPLPQEILPIRVSAGALAPGLPSRDLFISPDHALFFDDVLVPAKTLVNHATIQQVEAGEVTYYGIELDSHDMILAEGVAAETYLDDGQRNRFDNYAGDGSDLDPLRALRRDGSFRTLRWSGRRVAEIRAWIDARAVQLGTNPVYGELLEDDEAIEDRSPIAGYLERVSRDELSGWAWAESCPDRPVLLDLYLDGVLVATFAADQHRSDLQAAGIGSGFHSFRFRMPPAAYQREWTHVGVRARATNAHLTHSPVLLTSDADETVLV